MALVVGRIFVAKYFETTANTMTISRQGSHRKLLAEIAVIGLAHRGHVMQAERGRHMFIPKSSALSHRPKSSAATAKSAN